MEAGNEFFSSHYLGFRGHHEVLEVRIARDKEVTLIRAAEDEYVIRVRQAVPQGSYSRQQCFGLGEIHWKHSQMVSYSLEFGPTGISG